MGHSSHGSGPQRSAHNRGTVAIREVWEGFLEEAGCVLKEKQACAGRRVEGWSSREKAQFRL